MKIPAYQVGGPEKLWGIGGYGSSKVWFMRVQWECRLQIQNDLEASSKSNSRKSLPDGVPRLLYHVWGTNGSPYSNDAQNFCLTCPSSIVSVIIHTCGILETISCTLQPTWSLKFPFLFLIYFRVAESRFCVQVSVATARAVESQLSGRCALNKLGKIMKILVELE